MSNKEIHRVIDDRDRAVKQFIQNLNSIMDAVCSKNKGDEILKELREKYAIIRKENPNGVVEMAGPRLWKYRTQIHEQNVSFFLKNNFEEDIVEAHNGRVAEITSFEDVPILLQRAKRTWHSFTQIEQQRVIEIIRGLLRDYSLYISACKRLKELGAM